MPGLCLIRIFVFFLFGVLFFGAGGCTSAPQTIEPEYVIKTGSCVVLPGAFAQELDLKLAAYPYDFKKSPNEYNQIVFELASILSEESVMLAAAYDLGIQVTDAELAEAEAFQREDFPEDSFHQMLLENAISYSHWKNNLKKNLIIGKFIQQELKDKVEISSEDVVSFYNRHINEKIVADEEKLVSHLRSEKSQESYDGWIVFLKKQYPVDIDKNVLTKFLIATQKNKGQIND